METTKNPRRWALMASAVLAATALLAAGCSSSGGGTAAGAAPAAHHTAATKAAGNPVSMQQVRLQVRTGSSGAHLADGAGKSLYLFDSDTATRSTCSGACATYWPPVLATGHALAVGALKQAQLGTVTRSDGRKQVTYAGHPLYYYVGDTKAGDANGQGLDDFGAYWWLLTPGGKALTGSNSGGSMSSYGSSGGGW